MFASFSIVFSVIVTITYVPILTKSSQPNGDSSDSSLVDISEELKNIIFRRTNHNNGSNQKNIEENARKSGEFNRIGGPISFIHSQAIPETAEEIQKPQNTGSMKRKGNNGVKFTPTTTTSVTTTTTTATNTITPDNRSDLSIQEDSYLITTPDETSPDYIESYKPDSNKRVPRHSLPTYQKRKRNIKVDPNEDEELQSRDYDETQKSDEQSQYIEYREKINLQRRRADLRKYLKKKKHIMVQISDLTDNDPRLLVYDHDDEVRPLKRRKKHRNHLRGARRFGNKNQDDATENKGPETILANTEEENIETHGSDGKENDMTVETTPENTEQESIEINDDVARRYANDGAQDMSSDITTTNPPANTDEENVGENDGGKDLHETIDDENLKNLPPNIEEENIEENADKARKYDETDVDGTTNDDNPETSPVDAEVENVDPYRDKARRYANDYLDDMNSPITPETLLKNAEEESVEGDGSDRRRKNDKSVHEKTNFINPEPLPLYTEEENDETKLNAARRFGNEVNAQTVQKTAKSIILFDEPVPASVDEVPDKVDGVKNITKLNKNSQPNAESFSVVRRRGGERASTNLDFGDICLKITRPKWNKNYEYFNEETSPVNVNKQALHVSTTGNSKMLPRTRTTRTKTPTTKIKVTKNANRSPNKGSTKRSTTPKPKDNKISKSKKRRRMNDEPKYQNLPNEELQSADDNIQDEKRDSNVSEG